MPQCRVRVTAAPVHRAQIHEQADAIAGLTTDVELGVRVAGPLSAIVGVREREAVLVDQLDRRVGAQLVEPEPARREEDLLVALRRSLVIAAIARELAAFVVGGELEGRVPGRGDPRARTVEQRERVLVARGESSRARTRDRLA